MARKHTPFTPEFRRQMIDLVRSGRSPESLAKEFEPTAQTIRNWVAQTGRDDGSRARHHHGWRRLAMMVGGCAQGSSKRVAGIARLMEGEFLIPTLGDMVRLAAEMHAIAIVTQHAPDLAAFDIAVHAGLPGIHLR